MELPKKKKSSTICPATSTSGTNSKNPRLQANPTKKSTIPAVFSNNSSSPSSSSTTMQPVKHFTGLFGTRSKPESSPEPAASSSSSAEIPPEPVEENPDSEGVSLFQGDNRIFPSRQSAANLEQQQAVETGEVSNPVNSPALPANVTRNPANERRDEEVHVVNVAANRESLASSRGQSEDRMGDDGYPLVLGEYGPSDRQNALEKQRSIDDVIQQQMFVVADGIFRNNAEVAEMDDMARIFDELGEMLNDDTGASASRNERLHPQLAAAEEQQQLQQVSEFEGVINDARSGRPGPSGLSKQRLRLPEQQTSRPDQASFSSSTKAVNILPASRSLMEHPPSNLIAFGVRPRNPPTSSASSSSTSDFQKRVQRRRPANVEENSPLGWQAAKSSLKERVNYMYCNDFLADVYFLVGKSDNKQRIAAHKFVLSIGSVVFDAMFNGGLTPQNSRDPLEIELPDVEPSAFLTLLKFLYSDEVNIGPESVMTTLYTAKKYAVPAMETACVEFLKQSLEAENAFMLLTQARLFDEPQLEQLCLELIDKNTTDALAGDGFCEIDLDTLCAVLRRDSLRVREAPLFQAVVRWSRQECLRLGLPVNAESMRSTLGSALQLIRFPLMSVEEFAQNAAQCGLLSDREVVNLFLYYTVNPKPQVGYVDRPRSVISGKESVVSRFQRTENRWGYCGTSDRIKFTVDQQIYVVGLGLYGSVHGPHEYEVQIRIIHCGTGRTLAENDTSFVCDGTAAANRVCFREPVEILSGVTYIASACLKGPDSFYGTKGLRRIVHQAAEVTFQFTYAAMNNNGTSVEDGQIPEIIFYTAKH